MKHISMSNLVNNTCTYNIYRPDTCIQNVHILVLQVDMSMSFFNELLHKCLLVVGMWMVNGNQEPAGLAAIIAF